jgi:hypothetical protein
VAPVELVPVTRVLLDSERRLGIAWQRVDQVFMAPVVRYGDPAGGRMDAFQTLKKAGTEEVRQGEPRDSQRRDPENGPPRIRQAITHLFSVYGNQVA